MRQLKIDVDVNWCLKPREVHCVHRVADYTCTYKPHSFMLISTVSRASRMCACNHVCVHRRIDYQRAVQRATPISILPVQIYFLLLHNIRPMLLCCTFCISTKLCYLQTQLLLYIVIFSSTKSINREYCKHVSFTLQYDTTRV